MINQERILYRFLGNRESWNLMSAGLNGLVVTIPTQSIVDAYETLQGKTLEEMPADSVEFYQRNPVFNRDPRLSHSIMVPGDSLSFKEFNYYFHPFDSKSPDYIKKPNTSRSGYILKKFSDPLDRGDPYSGKLDYMVIRYAEILLNYIEALVESGDYANPDIVKYLNEIRERADMPPVDETKYNTQDKLRELYRRERRIELVFEGQRWWDIRRWGIGEDVIKGTVYGAYNPSTGAHILLDNNSYEVPKNDQCPIYIEEITANPNLLQNEGW
jgi:hypothetical protein